MINYLVYGAVFVPRTVQHRPVAVHCPPKCE